MTARTEHQLFINIPFNRTVFIADWAQQRTDQEQERLDAHLAAGGMVFIVKDIDKGREILKKHYKQIKSEVEIALEETL